MPLEIAARWQMPPWKVAGGSKVLWYARTEAVRHYQMQKSKEDVRNAELRRQEAEARRGRR